MDWWKLTWFTWSESNNEHIQILTNILLRGKVYVGRSLVYCCRHKYCRCIPSLPQHVISLPPVNALTGTEESWSRRLPSLPPTDVSLTRRMLMKWSTDHQQLPSDFWSLITINYCAGKVKKGRLSWVKSKCFIA